MARIKVTGYLNLLEDVPQRFIDETDKTGLTSEGYEEILDLDRGMRLGDLEDVQIERVD